MWPNFGGSLCGQATLRSCVSSTPGQAGRAVSSELDCAFLVGPAGLCSNQKFLSNLESAFKKLPSQSQQKIDLYHVFGVITETFRGSNGSEDLEKYFGKVYEHAAESGLVRLDLPPRFVGSTS